LFNKKKTISEKAFIQNEHIKARHHTRETSTTMRRAQSSTLSLLLLLLLGAATLLTVALAGAGALTEAAILIISSLPDGGVFYQHGCIWHRTEWNRSSSYVCCSLL
jgi:hypothetical protein